MKLLDLTLPTPAKNLACDEALLDWCEGEECEGVLRFWESTEYFVVLGYANKAAVEVDLPACERRGVPVLRRCSGGGTVLQGPGCLNYSLVLPIEGRLESITETNSFVMQRNRAALQPLLTQKIEILGCTDLAIGSLKFSGNSQRRRRNFLLFHGSFLLDFKIGLVEELLKFPSRQPDYRAGRTHREFLTNVGLSAGEIKASLQKAWKAGERLDPVPITTAEALVRDKYSSAEWNLRW